MHIVVKDMLRCGRIFLSVYERGTRGQEVSLKFLVIYSCCNKPSLKTTQVYSATVLEMRSLTQSQWVETSVCIAASSLEIVGEALFFTAFQHPRLLVSLDSFHLQSWQFLCFYCHIFSDSDSLAVSYKDLCDNVGPTR